MEIRNWLADEVSPAIFEFSKDYRFREAANWPLENLVKGSSNPLNLKVEKLHGELRGVLSKLGSMQKAIGEHQRENSNPQDTKERWLVDPKDYWVFTNRPFADSKEMELYGVKSLGDRVTRSFLARLESTLDKLNEQLPRLSVETMSHSDKQIAGKIERLSSKAKNISQECREQLNGFVEASIILTQVYSAFSRFVDLHWLPKDYAAELQESALANSIFQPTVDLDAIDRIAWALLVASQTIEELPDPEAVVKNAASRFKLVVDLSAKKNFWLGNQFTDRLSPTSWELFVLLVEARKYWDRPVEPFDLDSRNGASKKLKVQKQRLVDSLRNQFPGLAEAIISCEKSYSISIDRNQMEVFTRSTTERISRLCGLAETSPISTDVG